MSGPDRCPTTGKTLYRSRRKALAAKDTVRQMQVRMGGDKLVASVYRCPHCRGHHLTSYPPIRKVKTFAAPHIAGA